MAPIGGVSTANTTGSGNTQNNTGALGAPSESMFLQLLVAQIKNQDPSSPQDGMQFVAQLAQFSQLEQTIGIKQDMDAIIAMNTAKAAAPPTNQP